MSKFFVCVYHSRYDKQNRPISLPGSDYLVLDPLLKFAVLGLPLYVSFQICSSIFGQISGETILKLIFLRYYLELATQHPLYITCL